MSKRDKVMRGSRNERSGKLARGNAARIRNNIRELLKAGLIDESDDVKIGGHTVAKQKPLMGCLQSVITQSPDKGIVRATARPKRKKGKK